MLLGADVSQWQRPLGPNLLDFIVIKATQGAGFRDPMFATHVEAAKARGQVILAYHFGERGDGIGDVGALNFLATITPYLDDIAGLVYDCEYQVDTPTARYGPTYPDLNAWHVGVAKVLPGKQRYTYTASYYYGSVLGNPPPPLGSKLWWAHVVPNYNAPNPADLAAQVTSLNPDLPWPAADIRQVGINGMVGGIQPVDIDVTTLTRQQLAGGSVQPEGDLMALLTSQQASDLLTTIGRATYAIGGVVTEIKANLATVGSILEYGAATPDGKADHVGLVQLNAKSAAMQAELDALKVLLPAPVVTPAPVAA